LDFAHAPPIARSYPIGDTVGGDATSNDCDSR
jgi:hypothetical protein